MTAASSVPLPAPDVPVTTMTGSCLGLTVEEANQLGPLAIGESTDRLRLADPTCVQKTRGLHAAELRHRYQHVEDLRRGDVLGRIAEDLFDRDASVLELFLQTRPANPD